MQTNGNRKNKTLSVGTQTLTIKYTNTDYKVHKH